MQATLTDEGKVLFERAKQDLAKLAGKDAASDADTIESLLRGPSGTRAYLRDLRRGTRK